MSRLRKFVSLLTLSFCVGCTSGSDKRALYHERHSQDHIIIATTTDPTSSDPRIERDLYSTTFLRALYEGLTRANSQGVIKPAIADDISISDDLQTYTIKLKKTVWADGSPLTAHDFLETWISLLSPTFPAPNAYQFYPIKGAKEMKDGTIKADSPQFGVKALDDYTLEINLNQPTPYFLELLSCHFFFPVHKSARDKGASNTKAILTEVIGNGPFTFASYSPRSSYVFTKNPRYWDMENVQLKTITFQILEELIAIKLFEAGEIDWVGSPLSTIPQDSIGPLKEAHQLQIVTGAGTRWFRINTAKSPFSNAKVRKAFAYAINRDVLVQHVTKGNQSPAMAIVPPSFKLSPYSFFSEYAPEKASKLLLEGLEELGIKKNQLPPIKISYVTRDINHKITQTIQQQWKDILGVEVQLENSEFQVLIDRLNSGNYQLALGDWYADFVDPINFLDIFTSKNNRSNQTGWENKQYMSLIEKSNLETDHVKRFELLSQAQKILMDELPIAPLYFAAYNYLKAPGLEGVYFSPLGFLDFKTAACNYTPVER